MDDVLEIIKHFYGKGELLTVEPYGNGHINKTFLVTTTERKYILQKINTNAFKDVDLLMNNIMVATKHLLNKGIFTIKFLLSDNGKYYYFDGQSYYRAYRFIDKTIWHEKISSPTLLKKVAEAFGDLHHNFVDLDGHLLKESIPHFHDTPKRYNDLLLAIKNDSKNRLKDCQKEIKDIQEVQEYFSLITDALAKGEIHLSITHNDPKINNVLFDEESEEVKCVIDLDTIMPGSFLYDFGDALRSLFTGDNEDNIDPTLCRVDLDTYRNYLEGYWSKMKSSLTEKEIELLPYSPLVLSAECGMRFLEDYLKGDVYFHTAYPEHNLIRARTQIHQAHDILRYIDDLKKITKEITKR